MSSTQSQNGFTPPKLVPIISKPSRDFFSHQCSSFIFCITQTLVDYFLSYVPTTLPSNNNTNGVPSLVPCSLFIDLPSLGAIGILFRQTNVIWVGFSLLVNCIADYVARNQPTNTPPTTPLLILDFIKFGLLNLPFLIRKYLFHVLVILGFIVFLVYNEGSVTVGDKTAHTASLHIAQLFYFTLMTTLCTILYIKPFSKLQLFAFLWLAPVVYFCVDRFTIAHPYILADNRHYTFYLWKRILSPFKYYLVPFYTIGILYVWDLCVQHFRIPPLTISMRPTQQSLIGRLCAFCYFLCCFVALVPSPLLEFRYFLIPFYLLHIQLPSDTKRCLVELVVYTLINFVMIYVFLYRPFISADESTGRFMW